MFIGFPSRNDLVRFICKQIHLVDCPRTTIKIWIQAEVHITANEDAIGTGDVQTYQFAVFDGLYLISAQNYCDSLFGIDT